MGVEVRLGGPDDVDAVLSVYERSDLVRRGGHWPSRRSRLEHVAGNLRNASSWFLVGADGDQAVAMALVLPYRTDSGAGPIVPGTAFLDLIYVLPERWGEGIGGVMLDAVMDEARRRGSRRIVLSTHERDNERAHRLYRSRGFTPTGRTSHDEAGAPTGEWHLRWPRDVHG
jgi:GNAT superfamily N-acetyltransferase